MSVIHMRGKIINREGMKMEETKDELSEGTGW